MENNIELQAEPITAVIVRHIKPDRVQDFEEWAKGMTPIARKFAGYLGTSIIRPRDLANPEYVIVARFDNYAHLRTFMTSNERAEYAKLSEPMSIGEIEIQEMHGFESFFSLPDHPGTSVAPAKYKMAIITILAIYPTLLGVSTVTAFLFHGLPRPLIMLFTLMIMIPFMTYFLMPWVTRLFRFWLFPKTPIK